MNLLSYVSIFVLIIGIIIFAAGLSVFWFMNPAPEYCSAIICFGLLFVLGAILMITLSVDYDDTLKSALTL